MRSAMTVMVAAVLSAATVTFPATADALPCTFEQPYPDSGLSVCTGYGQTCPRWICAYPPGTPGKWDVNGRYEPKVG